METGTMPHREKISRRLLVAAAALLLALLVLGYWPALGGSFLFDDVSAIVDNPAIRSLDGTLAALLGRTGGLERPLSALTFAADYRRAGLDPRAFHATSLAVHLAAVALAFLFVRLTLRRAGSPAPDGLALAVAGLWGLHPLLSQAVSYVVQRAEALASLLYLGALLLLLAAYRRGRTGAGAALYAGGAATFALALQAKLIALSLPAALLLHLASFEVEPPGTPPRRRWASRLTAAAPLLAVSAAAGLAALRGLRGRADVGFDVARFTPGEYALTQLRVVLRYLSLVLWPAGQNLDYDIAPSRSLLDPGGTLAAALALAALAGVAAWLYVDSRRPGRGDGAARVERLAAFGLGWFLLLLSPTSSFVPVADLAFEHRAYLASLGIILAVAAGAALLLARAAEGPGARRAGAALALAAWGLLAVLLHQRNQVWTSPVALWADVVAKSPGKARAHFNYGHALSVAGQEQAAIVQYHLASNLLGRDTVDRFRVTRNLGASLSAAGRTDDAIAVLTRALGSGPGEHEIHNNLALAWKKKGDLARAESHAREALRLAPSFAEGYNTLGEIRVGLRDIPGALAAFEAAARLAPDMPAPAHNLAVVQGAVGMRAAACASWLRFGRIRGGEGAATAAAQRARLGCGPAP
jgi:protein O-mannosyl-transferase